MAETPNPKLRPMFLIKPGSMSAKDIRRAEKFCGIVIVECADPDDARYSEKPLDADIDLQAWAALTIVSKIIREDKAYCDQWERLSRARIADAFLQMLMNGKMRAEHRDVAGSCEACNEFWPCDASELIVHLAQADAARLQMETERDAWKKMYEDTHVNYERASAGWIEVGHENDRLDAQLAAQAERITHLEKQRADAKRIVTDLRREYGQHDGLGMHCTCGQSWTLGMIQALEDALVASRSPAQEKP